MAGRAMVGGEVPADAWSGVPRARPSRLRPMAAVLAVLHLCTACFTYVPPRTSPATGAQLSVELTDEGRVAHAPRVGPGVHTLRGMLREMDGNRYVVDVTSVTPIRGPELPVEGIAVTLGPRDVSNVRVRTLSKKRTFGVLGAVLAVVTTFIVSKGFRSGSTPPEGPPGGGPDQ